MSEFKAIGVIASLLAVGTLGVFFSSPDSREIKRAELIDTSTVSKEFKSSEILSSLSDEVLASKVKVILTGNCFSLAGKSNSCNSEELSIETLNEFNKRNSDNKLGLSYSLNVKREISDTLNFQTTLFLIKLKDSELQISSLIKRYRDLGINDFSELDRKLSADYVSNKQKYSNLKSFRADVSFYCKNIPETCRVVEH